MDASRFEQLLDSFFTGTATPEELVALERVLRADPEKGRAFSKRSLLEVQLHKAFTGLTTPKREAPQPRRRSRISRAAVWAVALALLVAVAFGTYRLAWQGDRNRPEQAKNPTPTRLQIESGVVRINGLDVVDVPKGERFEVGGEKLAVVRFPDGSSAELDPSTKATYLGSATEDRVIVELREGGGKFTVEKGSRNFRVDTPAGSVTVLGTEFRVALSPTPDATDGKFGTLLTVTVLSGKVQVEYAGQTHLVATGDSRVFGDPAVAQGPGQEQKDEPGKGPRDIKGVFKSFDPAKSTITVFRKIKGQDGPQTFDLHKEVLVVVDSKTVKVSDLTIEMPVQLRLSEDRKYVIEIREGKAEKKDGDKGPRDVKGTLKGLDLAKNTITILGKAKGKDGPRTYELLRDLPVVLDGKAAQLGDLKLETTVHLRLSEDRRHVIEIRDAKSKKD